MLDAHSVITHVTAKHVAELAQEMEVGLSRMYEILGKDNPYPKCKRLIRKIAKVNIAGVGPIRADMMSLFDELLREDERDVSAAELHKEAFEAVDALLSGKSADEQIRELRELVAIAELKITGIEKLQARNNLAPVA